MQGVMFPTPDVLDDFIVCVGTCITCLFCSKSRYKLFCLATIIQKLLIVTELETKLDVTTICVRFLFSISQNILEISSQFIFIEIEF